MTIASCIIYQINLVVGKHIYLIWLYLDYWLWSQYILYNMSICDILYFSLNGALFRGLGDPLVFEQPGRGFIRPPIYMPHVTLHLFPLILQFIECLKNWCIFYVLQIWVREFNKAGGGTQRKILSLFFHNRFEMFFFEFLSWSGDDLADAAARPSWKITLAKIHVFYRREAKEALPCLALPNSGGISCQKVAKKK